jgi:hypothetical protein
MVWLRCEWLSVERVEVLGEPNPYETGWIVHLADGQGSIGFCRDDVIETK